MIINREITNEASQQLINGAYHGFVETVWDIVFDAYDDTRKIYNETNKNQWEEETFTTNLVAGMQSAQRRNELSWFINKNDEVIEPDMLSGDSSPKKAKKIDITIYMAHFQELYYPIECKILGTKGKSPNEYVENGMKRFIVYETYASSLPEGGMIGYIISGTSASNVQKINKIITKKLTQEDSLLKTIHRNKQLDLYASKHICRVTGKAFSINHLFLNFTNPVEALK